MPDQPSWRCVTNLVIWCHSGSQRRPCKSMAGNDEDYGPYQLKQPHVIFVNLLLYTSLGEKSAPSRLSASEFDPMPTGRQ